MPTVSVSAAIRKTFGICKVNVSPGDIVAPESFQFTTEFQYKSDGLSSLNVDDPEEYPMESMLPKTPLICFAAAQLAKIRQAATD